MTRYKMRERLFALGDDFYIENDAGQRVFHVDGKLLTLRGRLVFKDADGNELCEIRERLISIRDTIEIRCDGELVATVRKNLINFLRDRYKLDMRQSEDVVIIGSILDHDYRFERNGETIARVSKKWFALRDTYGVEIQPGEIDVIILAATVAIDRLVHDEEEEADTKRRGEEKEKEKDKKPKDE
jgi:uncharacterized protein YxjI